MQQNFFKFFSIIFLLAVFWLPQNSFAQSEKLLIDQYLKGEIKITTQDQKEIISRYLNENTIPTKPYVNNYVSNRAIIFSESFDDVTFPPTSWSNTQVSGTGLWNRVTAGTSPTCTPHSGVGMTRFNCYSYTNGTDAILVTPSITIPSDVYRVAFWMYRDTGYPSNLDRVLVHYNTTPDLTGATLLGTINRSTTQSPVVASAGWYKYTFDMPTGTSGAAYIVFEGISEYGNNIFIDDVVLENIPSGPPDPASLVSPLNASIDVSINTTLNWFSGGGTMETGYRIYFGTDGGGVTPPTSIANNVDLGLITTTYTPASLSYGTTYYWEIIPYNGAGSATGTTVWSFTTMDDPTISTFPYTENFEGTFSPLNWSRYGGLLADPVVLVSSSEWIQDDYLNVTLTEKSAKTNIYGTTRDGWLMTPPIDLGTGTNYQLEFNLGLTAYGSTSPPNLTGVDDKFAVVISTDGGTTWTSTNTLRLWDNAGSAYVYNNIANAGERIIIDLTGYTGVVMIGFYGESTVTNADNDLFVDNIEIKEVPLVPIFSVTPTSKDFGIVQIGTSTADQTFTISNTGAGTLTISTAISIVGTDASQFILTDGNTYPINLTTGQSTTVYVNF